MHGETDRDLLIAALFRAHSETGGRVPDACRRDDFHGRRVLAGLRPAAGTTGGSPEERLRERQRQDRAWSRIRAYILQCRDP